MSSHGLREAFKSLGAATDNLLTATAEDVNRFKMEWAPATYVDNKKVEQSKGVWMTAARSPVVIPVIGVVDLERSRLGAYGNCYWNRGGSKKPDRNDLLKSKFNVAITWPTVEPGQLDYDLVGLVANQMFRLNNIQDNALSALKAGGHGDPNSTSDFARFEQDSSRMQGWMHFVLGSVYQSSVTKVKPQSLSDLSPSKSDANALAIKKEDIEDDPDEYFIGPKSMKLKHNEELPCFKENGDRVGRTSSELLRELYHGRWVRADVQLLMWNLKAEKKFIFQMVAVKVVVLNVPDAYSMNGITYDPMSKEPAAPGSKVDSDVKSGDEQEVHEGEDGEETVSESSTEGKKRAAVDDIDIRAHNKPKH